MHQHIYLPQVWIAGVALRLGCDTMGKVRCVRNHLETYSNENTELSSRTATHHRKLGAVAERGGSTMSKKLKTRSRTATTQAVLLRLAREWRKEAEIFRRDLGACIDFADRAQVTASYRKLEYCAVELEKLAQLR